MKLRLLGFALLYGASTAALADPEHDRIASDRAAANAKLVERERECATRFIVATCIEDARTEHRDVLKKLRQQALQLDDGGRRAAAESRRKAIVDKAQAQQARASDAVNDAPRVRVRRAASGASAVANRDDQEAAPSLPGAGAPGRRGAVEQRNQAQFEARQREARAHREAVQRRHAERAAKGKVAAPLPPGGSSVPH